MYSMGKQCLDKYSSGKLMTNLAMEAKKNIYMNWITVDESLMKWTPGPIPHSGLFEYVLVDQSNPSLIERTILEYALVKGM